MKDCTGPQGGWGGWPTGKGKKLSSSQAQLGQAACLAVAYFLSISGATSTPSALYEPGRITECLTRNRITIWPIIPFPMKHSTSPPGTYLVYTCSSYLLHGWLT